MSATLSTQCCVVGGGPAGLMAGFLLARAGVDVIVLEKHADFLRDFRGDTIHPSTLRIMDELGLLDEFLRLPHHKAYELSAWIGERQYQGRRFLEPPRRRAISSPSCRNGIFSTSSPNMRARCRISAC